MIPNNAEIRVAFASLVKLINLIGAEMLVGKYREDIDAFETCVRAKLSADVDGVTREERAAGVALAQALVDPVLQQLRERVRRLDASERQTPAPASHPRRFN